MALPNSRSVLRFSLCLLVFLTPIVVDDLSYLNFEAPKVFFFRSLVLVIFLLWLVGFVRGKLLFVPLSRLGYLLSCLFVIYFFLTLLTSLAGLSFHQSFYGSYFRQAGLLTLFHFGLLFWLFSQRSSFGLTFKDLALSVSASVSVVSVEVVWSALRHYLFPSAFVPTFDGRVLGLLGQPNFTGGFAAAGLPFLIYLCRQESSGWRRSLIAFSLGLTLLAILLTFSRAAYLALLVSFGLLVGFLAASGQVRLSRRYFLLLLILIPLALGSFSVYSHFRQNPHAYPYQVRRLLSLFDWQRLKGERRYEIFRKSWALALERPLTGYGLENFILAFPLSLRQGDEALASMVVDRAHSESLDVLVSGGFPLLLLYFLIFGLSFLALVRKTPLGDGGQNLFLLLFLTIIFVHNQFDIVPLPLTILFYAFLGYLAAGTPTPANFGRRVPPAVSGILTGLVLFVAPATLFLIYFFNFRSWKAEREFNLSVNYAQANLLEKAAVEAKRAVAGSPWTEIYRLKLSDWYLETAFSKKQPEDYRRALSVLIDTGTTVFASADYYYRLAQVYQFGGTTLSPDFASKATSYYQRAIKAAPLDPWFYSAYGKFLLSQERDGEAVEYLKRSIEIAPVDYAGNWLYLFQAYCRLGQVTLAQAALENDHSQSPEEKSAFLTSCP